MYCNVYVPQLQYAAGSGRLRASAVGVADRLDRAAGQDHRRVQRGGAPVRPRPTACRGSISPRASARTTSCTSTWPASPATEGVVFIGRAQEKTKLFRTEKRRDANGDSYPWIVASTGVVNHFYFYCVDDDFGPFFLKFCSYFPYNAKLCINGHDWAQTPGRQGRDRVRARWTTGSPRSTTPRRCRRSATGSDPSRSTPCCASGWPSCRTRSAPRTAPPATATTSRSCRPSSP